MDPDGRWNHRDPLGGALSQGSSVPEPVTAVMDTAGAWLVRGLAEVEAGLSEAVDRTGDLADRGTATLSAGGKRMRPMLVILCAGPGGGAPTIRAAVAVELIHTASLVHDDVLDRAPLRRGVPTIFSTDGRQTATSVGDALFAEAFGLLSRSGDMESVGTLSSTAVDLVRGELMQRAAAFDMELSEADYFARCRLKTGSLFSAACILGGQTGGAGDLEAMAGFGARVGLAFQLLDDVLDISGPAERTGKARGTDLLDGTVTLPLIEAIRTDESIAGIGMRDLDEASAGVLCDRIEETGALERVRSRALDLIGDAKSVLADSGLDRERVELLELVADGVVLRYS